MVNRDDAWRCYLASRRRKKAATRPGASPLTEQRIARHYGGPDVSHRIDIASSSAEGTGLWMALQIDREDHDAAITPGVCFQAALCWHEMLQRAGLVPLLEDTDGAGTYRLFVFFDEPVCSRLIARRGTDLTAGYADFGLHRPPRVFPAEAPGDGAAPSWLRLPGRHPTLPHTSRFWDGSRWLDDDESIEALVTSPWSAAQRLDPRQPIVRRTTDPEPPGGGGAPPPAPAAEVCLAHSATRALRSVTERSALDEAQVLRRTLEWLERQDRSVQAVVLGQVPGTVSADATGPIRKRTARDDPQG